MSHESALRATHSGRLSTRTDTERQRRLRQCAADLPFGIYSEQHGWGVVLRPVKRRDRWASEPHWYLVNYATGIECRVHDGENGHSQFFSWEEIGEHIADHEKQRAYVLNGWPTRTLWRHIFKLWG